MQVIQRIEKPSVVPRNKPPRVSEDSLCFGEGYVAVFDGATPVCKNGPYAAMPGMTDAHWIANKAAEIFPNCLNVRLDSVVPKLIHSLSQTFYDSAKNGHPKKFIYPEWMSSSELPSTTMSCAIRRGNKIVFMHIGDSPILIRLKSGFIIAMEGDPVLLENDKKILEEIKRLRLLHPDQPLTKISKLRKKNIPSIRHRMNRVGGYGVLSVRNPEALPMTLREFDVDTIQDFIIMTDGLWEAFDVFKTHDDIPSFFAGLSEKNGLKMVYRALKRFQENDPEGQEFPRIKMGDDVAAIHARIS